MLFENYGVEEKYYDSHMGLTTYTLGFLKYKERDIDDDVDDDDEKTRWSRTEGLPSHADKHFTSILHQNSVKGLEMKTKDGEWIGLDPSPTSFIFLAAESLQVGLRQLIIPNACWLQHEFYLLYTYIYYKYN